MSKYMKSFEASHPGFASAKQANYAKPTCDGNTKPEKEAPVFAKFNDNEVSQSAANGKPGLSPRHHFSIIPPLAMHKGVP